MVSRESDATVNFKLPGCKKAKKGFFFQPNSDSSYFFLWRLTGSATFAGSDSIQGRRMPHTSRGAARAWTCAYPLVHTGHRNHAAALSASLRVPAILDLRWWLRHAALAARAAFHSQKVPAAGAVPTRTSAGPRPFRSSQPRRCDGSAIAAPPPRPRCQQQPPRSAGQRRRGRPSAWGCGVSRRTKSDVAAP